MIAKVKAIKKYMGRTKPVTFSELRNLVANDKAGYEWMARECAKELGEELGTT